MYILYVVGFFGRTKHLLTCVLMSYCGRSVGYDGIREGTLTLPRRSKEPGSCLLHKGKDKGGRNYKQVAFGSEQDGSQDRGASRNSFGTTEGDKGEVGIRNRGIESWT